MTTTMMQGRKKGKRERLKEAKKELKQVKRRESMHLMKTLRSKVEERRMKTTAMMRSMRVVMR